MKHLAIFGGSFDPVHNAHIEMAKCSLKEFNLNKIVFVPAYKPPHKINLTASAEDRYNMLKLALKQYPEFDIDVYELSLRKEVFSYQMLDYFKEKYNNYTVKMIIGSDSFNQLSIWKEPEYICKNYGFYVLLRPNIEVNKLSPYYKYCEFSKTIISDISSTYIREKIKLKQDISCFVDKTVLTYIKEKKLYL